MWSNNLPRSRSTATFLKRMASRSRSMARRSLFASSARFSWSAILFKWSVRRRCLRENGGSSVDPTMRATVDASLTANLPICPTFLATWRTSVSCRRFMRFNRSIFSS